MRLTEKLLGYLHRAFDRDPEAFLAFRLRHDGSLVWAVADGVLTTVVSGDSGVGLSIDLSAHTIRSLVEYLAAQPGYSVSAMAPEHGVSACCLIDGQGDQDASNGDHIKGSGSVLRAYLDAVAVELTAAKTQVENAIAQMSITSAEKGWLDEWGGYFGIPRSAGEADAIYGHRIIAEVVRPRGNNVAIEEALFNAFGQSATVVDLRRWAGTTHLYNGSYSYNGAINHDAPASPVYGLFSVVVGYDLLSGGDQAAFGADVRALVERMRDGGTQLDSLFLSAASLLDSLSLAPTDSGTLSVTIQRYFDGVITYNGAATYAGTEVVAEVI